MQKLQVYRPRRRTAPVPTQDSPLGDKDSESFRISFDGRVPEREGRLLKEGEWRSIGDRHPWFLYKVFKNVTRSFFCWAVNPSWKR